MFNIDDIIQKALVIAQWRVQYDKYFLSFPCFAIYMYFEITTKSEKIGKYLLYCARLPCDN